MHDLSRPGMYTTVHLRASAEEMRTCVACFAHDKGVLKVNTVVHHSA